MDLLAGIPGLIALLVCIRRGPERALIDVYLPVLLLLPATSFHWNITGRLTLSDTAVIPIALFSIVNTWRDWEWSFIDFLLMGYVATSVISAYVNKGFSDSHNQALELTCHAVFPYLVAKGIRPREDLFEQIARRFVVCVTIVAIINVWEFRMGKDLFVAGFSHLFPDQISQTWQGRMGFNRTFGPYVHPILGAIIFAIAYRLNQWLNWGKYWRTKVPLSGMRLTRACQLWLIVGSLMTISRGPWLAAVIAAAAVWMGRAHKRKQTIVVLSFLILVVGLPIYNAAKSYVWVAYDETSTEMENSAAYRHDMIEDYIAVVEERPVWGWGRSSFPVVGGMRSIDNEYLLLALNCGELALFFFVAIISWTIARLVLFCRSHHGSQFPGSIGLALLGIHVLIVISITTVYLGGQTYQLFFLLLGWSEALILAPAVTSKTTVEAAQFAGFNFRRVMA
jgi:hypothetical protein